MPQTISELEIQALQLSSRERIELAEHLFASVEKNSSNGMLPHAQKIYQQTKGIPPSDKAKLVDLILADLDVIDPAIENAWIEEVLRRQEAVRSGKMRTYTLEEVLGRSL
jgi:hypothetical protein